MTMYNTLHGRNEHSQLLLTMLGIDQPDGKWQSGRFRDINLNADGTRILLYTRNGGGNRDCFHADSSDSEPWGGPHCKNHSFMREEDEYTQSGLIQKTGRRIVVRRYVCEAPNSEECACPGCAITYRLPKHPNYLSDCDDDFDSTYATIEFSVPEAYADIAKGLATGKDPATHEELHNAFMERMKTMSLGQIEADPKLGPLVKMLGSFADKAAKP